MKTLLVSVARAHGADWTKLRDALGEAGVQVPVGAHEGFPTAPDHEAVLFGVGSPAGQLSWGGLAISSRSHTVPWRRILRVQRLGQAIPSGMEGPVAKTLVQLAEGEGALRLSAELWQPDVDARQRLVHALRALGFRAVATPRMYTHTVLIDLSVPEAALFGSFHATCRRHIRALEKHGLRCELVTDARFAERLHGLDTETMSRTGGQIDPIDWPAMIRFASHQPALAHLVGVFRSDVSDESALLGYVLGLRHGDTVEYFRAASARPADLRAPLLYGPAWDVMRWGQRIGARWFDFGGASPDSAAGAHRTSGIADFKRSFRTEITEVGGELVYAPSAVLDSIARTASRAVKAIRSVRDRSRGAPSDHDASG